MSGIQIRDYGPPEPPEEGPRWTTQEMQEEFEVLSFVMGFVVVRRRSDGAKGTLNFTHNPRVYFDFVEEASG